MNDSNAHDARRVFCNECGFGMVELPIGQQLTVSKKVDDREDAEEVVVSKIKITGRGIYFCRSCKSFWQDQNMVGNRRERRASASRARRVR